MKARTFALFAIGAAGALAQFTPSPTVPSSAGATATKNGAIAYDTTKNNLHAAQGDADSIVLLVAAGSPPPNGDCAQFRNAGGKISLISAGSPCGSGGGGITSATVKTASQLGAVLDCDLSTGLTVSSGACTDNTSLINDFLATATATNPVRLIMDGGTITAGIRGPTAGHWSIEGIGWDSGFFVKSGSNSHGIRNTVTASGWGIWGATRGTPGVNIQLQNFRINGNHNGDSTGGLARQDPGGNWLFAIYLDNMTYVRVRDVWVYDSPSFAILCNACTDAVFDGNREDAASAGLNQDGIHIMGPSSQIRVSNNWCNSSDDCIAMNAAEGYGGAIDGVAVTNSQCVNCLTAYRQLSSEDGGAGNNWSVKNVTISNYSGNVASSHGNIAVAFRLGETYAGSKAADIMRDVSISNCSFTASSADAYMIDVNDNLGQLNINGLTWIAPIAANALLNFRSAATVSSLTMANVKLYRTAAGSAAAYLLQVPSGKAVKYLRLRGVAVEDEQGQSFSAIAGLIDIPSGGSIGTVDLGNIDTANITSIFTIGSDSRVTMLTGFPSISGNGTVAPALSAGSGISVGGNFPNQAVTNTGGGGGGTGKAICTAVFSSSGGTLHGLTISGCITGVTRASAGFFHVSLSSPPANYAVTISCGNSGVNFAVCGLQSAVPLPSTTLDVGTFTAAGGSGTFIDVNAVSVIITEP